MEASLAAYDDVDQGAVRERRLKGWENVKRFHKMFVDAGGRLVVSGNLNDRYVPGLELFQEMRVMREVGMTPMQIIVGSTKYAAQLVQKQDSLGTVEAGKTADVLVVSEDPLRDIGNRLHDHVQPAGRRGGIGSNRGSVALGGRPDEGETRRRPSAGRGQRRPARPGAVAAAGDPGHRPIPRYPGDDAGDGDVEGA